MKEDRKRFALLLREVLIEIKSLDDRSLAKSRSLAHIVHNLPDLLISEEVDWISTEKTILSRARFYHLDGYINIVLADIDRRTASASRS